MEKYIAPFEIKALTEAGQFEGYASVFNNVDRVGDVIEAGAFKEFMTNSDDRVMVLLMHNSMDLPIGTAEVKQDGKGLYFKGALVMDDPMARRAYAGMKAKTLTAMSIGYTVLPGGAEIMESGVRVLKALKLWEISPVVWGANPEAQITAIKSAPEAFDSVKDLERFLRDAGMSRNQARALASGHASELIVTRCDAGEVADKIAQISESAKVALTDF